MYFIELIQENAQMEVMDLTDKSDAESETVKLSSRSLINSSSSSCKNSVPASVECSPNTTGSSSVCSNSS